MALVTRARSVSLITVILGLVVHISEFSVATNSKTDFGWRWSATKSDAFQNILPHAIEDCSFGNGTNYLLEQDQTNSSFSILERCSGPEGCELCYNTSARIVIYDFKYTPEQHDYRQKVMLMYPKRFGNPGSEEVVKMVNYTRKMNHTFSWQFDEPLDFATFTILNSTYPTKPLYSPNEEIYIGVLSGPAQSQFMTFVEPVTYEDTIEVRIPPKVIRRVSAHSFWRPPDELIRFEATVEFIPNEVARCVQCAQGNSICYEVTPPTGDILDILKAHNFKGEIISTGSRSIKAIVKGDFKASYGEITDILIF
ncbi:unnamed protein product [Allacma fusca]|uniref:Uncharacterized protein n=1 Tax=Allacma fusca TaxID=39272 RepID=A0A8J2LN27_9HEXA|nr:unnamed protein product [Allacma fusca]